MKIGIIGMGVVGHALQNGFENVGGQRPTPKICTLTQIFYDHPHLLDLLLIVWFPLIDQF